MSGIKFLSWMSYLRTHPEELLADLMVFPCFWTLQAQERVSRGTVNNKKCQGWNFRTNDICKNSSRITHPIKIHFLLFFRAFFDLEWVRREMYKKKACCNYFLCKNFHFKNSSEMTHCTENLNLLFKTAQQDCHCYVHNIQQHMWGNTPFCEIPTPVHQIFSHYKILFKSLND